MSTPASFPGKDLLATGALTGAGKGIAATEVMLNGPDDVYVEQKGRIERAANRLVEGEDASST